MTLVCGTNSAYVGGCGCDDCLAAHAAAEQDWRKRTYLYGPQRVSSLGTRRRLQALAAIGWPQTTLARMMGRDQRHVSQTMRGETVYLSTHRMVEALYRELSMKPGPSRRTKAHARSRGWAPPLAWDDIDNDTKPKGMAA